MINTALMKERMSELNLKEEYLADKMKMAQSTLNLKINKSINLIGLEFPIL